VAVLQIVGNQSGAGKTSLAAALLVAANAAGKKAAYYKPFSDAPGLDADTAFIGLLLQSIGGPSVPDPRKPADSHDFTDTQTTITNLQSEADLVIIEGPDAATPLDIGGTVLLVHKYSQQASISDSVSQAGPLLAGIVVNATPIHRRDEVARDLAGQALPVAVIPESRSMLTVTVEQLANHLGGQWVLDPVNADAPVERFMIGGNIMDEGPTYFDRYPNQAVITRVERPDIQMASMCDKTCCLVLTGPGEPTEYIKSEALKREVPLIQVRTNTMDTAESLAGLLDRADARTITKANHFAGLLEQYLGSDAIQQLIG
jgi:BioD-like phosphotransacetylase family protein